MFFLKNYNEKNPPYKKLYVLFLYFYYQILYLKGSMCKKLLKEQIKQ